MVLRAAIAAVLVPLISTWAQEGVQLTVVPGAGGTVRAGAMAPVHVVVQNAGPAVSGAVVLHWVDSFEGRSAVVEYRVLELPKNSRKAVTLYSEPGPWTSGVRVVLREHEPGTEPRSGRELASFAEDVRLLNAEAPVIGVLGPPLAGLPQRVDDDGNDLIERLYFSAEHMPDDAAGWELCDAVVYTPDPGRVPSAAELRALREYVFLGGDLVIQATEPSAALGGPAFRDFVPYVPAGQAQTYLPWLGASAIHSVGRVEDGDVLLEDGGTPLVIRRAYGLGSVTVVTFDLSHPAVGSSENLEALWREVVPELYAGSDEGGPESEFGAYDSFTERALAAVTSAPDVRVQLFVVVLLIGLYALAVGPGDYLLAKRYRRPMLTWVTFPSMVLVFTSLAFLGARVWVGGNEELSAHRSITYFPEGALYNEAFGYFASVTRTYRIGHADAAALRPLAHTLDSPDRTIIDGDSGDRLQRIPTWTARAFTASRVLDETSPVTFDVEVGPHSYSVTVTNNDAVAIAPVALVAAGLHFVLREGERPAIPPGDTAEFEVMFIRGIENRSLVGGGLTEIWSQAGTRAPRYRSWDHRALLARGDFVLTYAVGEPAPAALLIDGEEMTALDTTDVRHVVKRSKEAREP